MRKIISILVCFSIMFLITTNTVITRNKTCMHIWTFLHSVFFNSAQSYIFCGNTRYESHIFITDGIGIRCKGCGYFTNGPGAIVKPFSFKNYIDNTAHICYNVHDDKTLREKHYEKHKKTSFVFNIRTFAYVASEL